MAEASGSSKYNSYDKRVVVWPVRCPPPSTCGTHTQLAARAVRTPHRRAAHGWDVGQVYIDGKKTIAQGRKIPKQYCVEYPQMTELKEVLEHLGLEFSYEDSKAYPRDLTQYGRFRVQLKDPVTGEPAVEGITSRDVMLRKMGELIPKLKCRADGPKKPGTPGIPFPGYPETLMPVQISAPMVEGMPGAVGATAAAGGGGSSKKKGKK
jgi:signal recognition particle subunit SEC65